jgi:hypothetical protein
MDRSDWGQSRGEPSSDRDQSCWRISAARRDAPAMNASSESSSIGQV